MKKNLMHFIVMIGLMAGNLFGAGIPAQSQKKTVSERFSAEKVVWQRGIAAAKKRHIQKEKLNKQELRYYNTVLKRIGGLTALLAAIGMGVGLKLRKKRAEDAVQEAKWAERQQMFADQDAANLAYDQGQKRYKRQEEIQRRFRAAIDKGHSAEAERLLARGAQVDDGALLGAVEKGNAEMVDFLLKNGANVNAMDVSRGRTALMMAALKGNLPILERLLQEENIDINTVDSFSRTALRFAAQANKPFIVERLLQERNIDTSILDDFDEESQTAIDIARKKGYIEIVRMLEEHSRR
ncbi:ankyrin repeat domain-containing protein [Candidatus Dependentiae bacterium]